MENWFETLVGFPEESPEQVRSNLLVSGDRLRSKQNGREWQCGRLEITCLNDLRKNAMPGKTGLPIRVQEIIADVQTLHQLPENRGAMFQAASQFNLLEMANPAVTPEAGIGGYQYDLTQGPACAIACGAGTIYRQYLVEVNGKRGQSAENQIDCLDELGEFFGNEGGSLWHMQNGYALATQSGLDRLSANIRALPPAAYQEVMGLLKVGIQWDTEVTLSGSSQLVSQVYCSALPVAYSDIAASYWEPFACLILRATYEATFWAALHNSQRTGNNRLFLTLVGGGAFGNPAEWIADAVMENLHKFRQTNLDVRLVSYGQSSATVQAILASVS